MKNLTYNAELSRAGTRTNETPVLNSVGLNDGLYIMKKYVEFMVWNNLEERSATDEEISDHIRIKPIGDGKVSVEVDKGYSVLTD